MERRCSWNLQGGHLLLLLSGSLWCRLISYTDIILSIHRQPLFIQKNRLLKGCPQLALSPEVASSYKWLQWVPNDEHPNA